MSGQLKVNLKRLEEIAVPLSEEELALRKERRENYKWWKMSANVALLLRKTIRTRNLAQEDFASIMGLSEEVAKSYLSGKRNFTLKEIATLEKKLNIKIIKDIVL